MCLEFVWLTSIFQLMLAIERPINWLLLVRTILIIMLIFESIDALFYLFPQSSNNLYFIC